MTRARDLSNFIGSGSFSSTTFTATAGQTVFTIAHTQGFCTGIYEWLASRSYSRLHQ